MNDASRPRPRKVNPGPFASVSDVIQANRDAGDTFFEYDAALFSEKRVDSELFGGRFFVGSAKTVSFGAYQGDGRRRFFVWVALKDGVIEEVGHRFGTLRSARRAAKKAAASAVVLLHEPPIPGYLVESGPKDDAWRAWTTRRPIPGVRQNTLALPIGSPTTKKAAQKIVTLLNEEHEARVLGRK